MIIIIEFLNNNKVWTRNYNLNLHKKFKFKNEIGKKNLKFLRKLNWHIKKKLNFI